MLIIKLLDIDQTTYNMPITASNTSELKGITKTTLLIEVVDLVNIPELKNEHKRCKLPNDEFILATHQKSPIAGRLFLDAANLDRKKKAAEALIKRDDKVTIYVDGSLPGYIPRPQQPVKTETGQAKPEEAKPEVNTRTELEERAREEERLELELVKKLEELKAITQGRHEEIRQFIEDNENAANLLDDLKEQRKQLEESFKRESEKSDREQEHRERQRKTREKGEDQQKRDRQRKG